MAVFAFYSFEWRHLSRQPELTFPELTPSAQYDEYADVFHEVFPCESKVELHYAIRRKDGTYDKYAFETFNNDVLANRGGILIMTIDANKQKTTIVDKHKIAHQHNPYSYVIVDYRQGQNLIAIQKNAAFNNDPEKLADIILHTFNRLFESYDLRMTMKPLSRDGLSFWDAVNEIRQRHHDKVKRISLDFTKANDPITRSSNTAIALISGIAQKLSAKGMMVVETNDDNEVDLDKVYEDMLALSEICSEQREYELNVHFFSYGIYRFGADVMAQFGVEDKMLDNYITDDVDIDLFGVHDTLDKWLVKMKDLLESQDYAATTITEPASKPSRRR